MKTSIFATALILFAAFTAVAQHNPDARPLDLKVNGVGYDTTYASVVKIFGKAKKQKDTKEYSTECMDKPATFREMKYDGLEVGLLGDIRARRMKVHSIWIDSAKWNVSGVTVGASEADVIKKFGKPRLRVTNDETHDVTYEYDMARGYGTVTVYFNKNKITRIAMTEAIC